MALRILERAPFCVSDPVRAVETRLHVVSPEDEYFVPGLQVGPPGYLVAGRDIHAECAQH